MKKLENIPKRNIFKVPDGYFENLPGIIQARVSKPEPAAPWFVPALKFALPVVALIALGVFWYSKQPQDTLEQQLAEIQTEQLVAFLDDATLNFDDLTESVTWSENDLNELEEKVFSTFEVSEAELDILFEEFDVENF